MIWLHNARIAATFVVIILHVSALVVTGNSIGTYNWWIGNIYDSMSRWCVPVFVMISGALLLDQEKKEDVNIFYMKRISKILTPLIFWSVFFLAAAKFLKGEELTVSAVLRKIQLGKPYYHMWFLYMIAVLYLFVPFFRKIASNSSARELKFLVFFSFALAASNAILEKIFPVNNKIFFYSFFSYIPYFFTGHLIRTSKFNFSKSILWIIFIISSILTIFGFYFLSKRAGQSFGFYFYSYLSMTVMPMSISMLCMMKSCIRLIINDYLSVKISSLTFGVYLVHPIYIDIIVWFGYKAQDSYQIILIPVAAFLIFGLSLYTSLLISRIPLLRRII
ncbi:MAG: acyltransferase [Candidatus Electronema sp. VV]